MKSKIGFRILICVFLIGFFCFEISDLKIENQNIVCENQFKKMEIDFEQSLNACEVENQKQESNKVEEIEVQKNPFFNITDDDRNTICYIVAGEAKGEPIEGKMAVAQCILNAMKKNGFSAEEVRIKYRYSGWDSDLQYSNPEVWGEVVDAVNKVFYNGEFVTENPILYFYAPNYGISVWHESLQKDQVIGGHSFHYLKDDVNAEWFVNLKTRIDEYNEM